MAQSGPDQPVRFDREREHTISLLGEHFARDDLTLEELERRIELAYRARDLAALRDLTRDLPTAATSGELRQAPSAPVPEIFAPEKDRIVAVLSHTQRFGVWHVPRRLRVWSVMSEMHLDLTQAVLSAGVTELELRGILTEVKIVVPPGVRVVMQAGTVMSEMTDLMEDPPPVGSGAPIVRITGFVVMTELKISVRRREVMPESL